MNRNIGSTDSVDTNQKQQRRPLAVPRSPYPGRSARRSGVSQKEKIESKFSLTRPTPLEISPLFVALTQNASASPLESVLTKHHPGWGGKSVFVPNALMSNMRGLKRSKFRLFIRLQTLCRAEKTQVLSFQQNPNSFRKIPGGGRVSCFRFKFKSLLVGLCAPVSVDSVLRFCRSASYETFKRSKMPTCKRFSARMNGLWA